MSNEEKPAGGDEVNPPAKMNNGQTARQSWQIAGDKLAHNLRSYPQEQKELFVECFRWCVNNDISRQEFCQAIGVQPGSGDVVWKLLNGKYLNPKTGKQQPMSGRMMRSMREWLSQQRILRSQRTDFVTTPSAKKIWNALDLAREEGDFCFIIGESHLGKTEACIAYQAFHNHGRTIYARLGAASGIGGMLEIIGKSVAVLGDTNRRNMIDRITKSFQTGDLVILDEFHELMLTYRRNSFFACAEIIREFYDRCHESGRKVGFALCITKAKWSELETVMREDMKQIIRRGVIKCLVGTREDAPLPGDVKAIVEHHGLPFPKKCEEYVVEDRHGREFTEKPYEILRQLGTTEGLKAIVRRVKFAKRIAHDRTDAEGLSWRDFIRAHLIIKGQYRQEEGWS